MKYLFLFCASSILLACTNSDKQATDAKAQKDSIAQIALKDSANYTTIQWIDSVDQYMGSVNEGQVVEIAWRFRNTGTKPLIIANVQPGCGCTLAEKPEEPIAPGKEGVIKAKFDSKDHPGTQHKYVYVRANDKNKNGQSEDQLSFRLDVNPK